MTLIVWTLVLSVLMYGPVTEACPSGCSCKRSTYCDGTYVGCINDGLTEVPTNIPTDTCELYLQSNQITTIPGNAFNGLPNLQTLYLQSNQITTIPGNAFNGLPNLQTLELSWNKITVIQDNAFNGLQNLSYLQLQGNQITNIPDNAFNGLPNLQTLYLTDNQITVVPENAFKGLKNLSILDIEGNQITVLDKRFFKDLPKLTRLAVERNPLHCDCILAEFLSFAKSRKLTLKYDKEPECSTPGYLTGVMIKDLSLKEMGCYLTTATKEDPTTVTTKLLETPAISIPVREMVRDRLVRLLYSTKEQDIETYQELVRDRLSHLSYSNNEQNIETHLIRKLVRDRVVRLL